MSPLLSVIISVQSGLSERNERCIFLSTAELAGATVTFMGITWQDTAGHAPVFWSRMRIVRKMTFVKRLRQR